MNERADETLIEKIKSLAPEQRAEVEDFVDFLATRTRRREAIERLRALQGQLPPAEITDAEMQEVVDSVREVRAQMRTERSGAGRP